ncbi:MAG TPA: glycosyltransferase family 4 protein, partial [Firmicutes bacterium]|nr:glycosyltransferase family 4 protein [Bacillota bacterium]
GRPNDRAGELGIPNDSFVVLTVGRLTEQKNQGLLLQAIRRLVPRVPSIVCVILGEGELRAYLEHLVREMGLDRHVFLLGHRADVRLWYGSAHVFVLTSLWEGLPLAVLEALASGLPVVSTRVSGVEEVVTDGIEGYLVESCPDAIAQRIEQLFLDSAMREIMGARARKKALMYSESEMCRRYYELYRRLLYEG